MSRYYRAYASNMTQSEKGYMVRWINKSLRKYPAVVMLHGDSCMRITLVRTKEGAFQARKLDGRWVGVPPGAQFEQRN
jgi:hypothetical protein